MARAVHHRLTASLSTLALIGAAQITSAQTSDASATEYLRYLESLEAQIGTPVRRSSGGGSASTVGIPGGFSIPKNTGFIAVALSDKRERSNQRDTDASGAFGMGFGDPVHGVGVDFVIGLSSLGKGTNGFDAKDFGDSGSINVKLSKQFASPLQAGHTASVALGVGRLHTWGDADKRDRSYYIAGSSTFSVNTNRGGSLPGMLTLGYGTDIGTQEDKDGLFAGVGLGLNDWASVGASWYGDEAIAGMTFSRGMTPDLDVQIGVSYGDVGHANSDGRWMVSFAIVDKDLF
ncbi:MAG: hypothetical protein N4A61_14345 [Pelagimonas sp.]|nr:hypothetical protein [Pelagimonas sp.]